MKLGESWENVAWSIWLLSGLRVWLPELLYTPLQFIEFKRHCCKNTANQIIPVLYETCTLVHLELKNTR